MPTDAGLETGLAKGLTHARRQAQFRVTMKRTRAFPQQQRQPAVGAGLISRPGSRLALSLFTGARRDQPCHPARNYWIDRVQLPMLLCRNINMTTIPAPNCRPLNC